MLFYTVGQSRVFLVMLVAGLGIGAWYSLLMLWRALMEAGPVLSLGLDLLFGAGAAVLVILGSLRASEGELRLYALLGALSGFFLFRGIAVPAGRGARRLVRALGAMLRRAPHPLARKIFR